MRRARRIREAERLEQMNPVRLNMGKASLFCDANRVAQEWRRVK
jgi:hypothetical protein